MNTEEAIIFLKCHQPMPDDIDMNDELIKQYDEARLLFQNIVDDRCISLFINSFGKGSGYGVYQLIEDTLKKQNKEIVIQEIIKGLTNENKNIKYWCSEIAANYNDARLIKALVNAYNNSSFDTKFMILTALEHMNNYESKNAMGQLLKDETDENIKKEFK